MKPEQEKQDELLVTAMTRPTMIGGFTLSSLILSLYVPFIAAMILRSLTALLLIPLCLLGCYMVCLKDVYLFGIAAAASRLRPCVNKRLWRIRRYAPR